MTVEKAGEKWGYGKSQIERLRQLCLSMPDKFPLVAGHVTIPEGSPKIFVPDKRSKKGRGYFYRYLFDAIGTDSLLFAESIGITDTDKEAHLRELFENKEIKRKDPQSTSWETIDFMIPRNRLWGKKSSQEKRSYISELISKLGIARHQNE